MPQKTDEAALDKQRSTSSATQDKARGNERADKMRVAGRGSTQQSDSSWKLSKMIHRGFTNPPCWWPQKYHQPLLVTETRMPVNLLGRRGGRQRRAGMCRCVQSGSCRCALIGVPCSLKMLSMFNTFDYMLKLTISPQAKRVETDNRQGTPTRVHLQPPNNRAVSNPISKREI